MGTRGPLPSDPELKAPEGRAPLAPPAAQESWLDVIKGQWDELWRSPLAGAFADVDVPALIRLFEYRDQWTRTKAEWEALGSPLITVGSRGQERMHPSLGHMSKLEDQISKLESYFGLTPSARVRLSIELGQNKLTWEAVGAAATKPGGRELKA